jgi:hypothetical protein
VVAAVLGLLEVTLERGAGAGGVERSRRARSRLGELAELLHRLAAPAVGAALGGGKAGAPFLAAAFFFLFLVACRLDAATDAGRAGRKPGFGPLGRRRRRRGRGAETISAFSRERRWGPG